MLILTLLFAGAGVLIMVTSVPLLLRRVPPNALYGLRVPATLADEEVWYEANARTARELFALGAVELAGAIGLRWVPGITEDVYAGMLAALLVVGGLAAAAVGWRRADRMLLRRRAP